MDADYYRGPNSNQLRERWLEYHRLCCDLNPAHWSELNKEQLEMLRESYFRRFEYLDRVKREIENETGFLLDCISRVEGNFDGH